MESPRFNGLSHLLLTTHSLAFGSALLGGFPQLILYGPSIHNILGSPLQHLHLYLHLFMKLEEKLYTLYQPRFLVSAAFRNYGATCHDSLNLASSMPTKPLPHR